jgi:site-specific recombinase XerD
MQDAITAYLLELEAAGRSPLTIASYRQALNDLSRFLKATRPLNFQRVKVEQLRAYLGALQVARLKPSTIRTRCTIISCFFNWLLEEGIVKENPMLHLRRPKKPHQLRPIFTTDELVEIIQAAGDSRNPIRNRAIIYLLLDCGLRLSELSNLKATDYDARTSTLTINGKGSKVRLVRPGRHCREAFEQHLALTNGCLWGANRGGLRDLIYRLGRKAGVKTYPHKFRHSFANRFLDAGGSLDALQCLLGHTEISTTMIYARAGQQERALRSHAEHSPGDRLAF